MNNLSFHEIIHGDYGRKIAYLDVEEVTEKNVVKVAAKIITCMIENRTAVKYLNEYVKGEQPVYYRTRTGRDDINNPVCENFAFSDTQFEIGQIYGEPIQFVSLSSEDGVNKNVDKLNDYCDASEKHPVDIEVGTWVARTGFGFKAIQRTGDPDLPFRFACCNPMFTAIGYSSSNNQALLAVQEKKDIDGNIYYICFSATHQYVIKNGTLISQGTFINEVGETVEILSRPHAFGGIPIEEIYSNPDRIASPELVISIYDAINELQSNRVDSVAQWVQAWVKFVNVEIDKKTFEEMKMSGALVVKSNNGENKADVDIIGQELNQGESQTLKDDLYESSRIILAIPNREGNTGGDTQGAVELRNGHSEAQLRAKIREPFIKRAEKKLALIALKIMKQANIDCPLKVFDFGVNIVPSPTDNLLVRSETLQILLNCRINPAVAIRACGLWSDPEKAYLLSKPYLDVMYKTIDEYIANNGLEDELEKANQIIKSTQP